MSERTICSGDEQRCLCSMLNYWNGKTCLTKKIINESCERTYECRNELYLNCQLSICSCESTLNWNGSQCLYKKSYNES